MTTTEHDELEELGQDETGFRIDGGVYPVPTLDSLDMDESQILFDRSGLGIEDFVPLGDEASQEEKDARSRELSRNVKNPAFLRAMMEIAYRRGNPKLPIGRVRDVIAGANTMAAMSDLLRTSVARKRAGDPNVPLEPTTEPQRSSDGSSVSSSSSSGNGSPDASDAPDENPARTGAMRSDTSPTSDPTGSVA